MRGSCADRGIKLMKCTSTFIFIRPDLIRAFIGEYLTRSTILQLCIVLHTQVI